MSDDRDAGGFTPGDLPEQLLAEICLRRLDHAAFPQVEIDAMHVKRRKEGRAVFLAVVTASGLSDDGEWEPLGVSVGDSEDAEFWTSFLLSLRHRGLHGVRTVSSADHGGIDDAVAVVFPGAHWTPISEMDLENDPTGETQIVDLEEDERHDSQC